METIIDLNVLFDAYKASMNGSSWKNEPQKFETNFLSEIVSIKKDLESREYKTLKGSEFILNERGKIRYVHGGRMRDRVVRHALCDTVLNPAIKKYLIYNNGASQKNKGITFARDMFEKDLHNFYLKNHTNEGYIGFVDMSKFYDNIRHDIAKSTIEPLIDEFSYWLFSYIIDTFKIDVSYLNDEDFEYCLDLIFNSIEYHKNVEKEWMTGEKFMAKSVDIGDQISQTIGMYYPIRIDNYAKIVRGCKWYGRYMDDIYIMGETKEFVNSVIKGIAEQARNIGLFVNEEKTQIAKLSGTYKYLQIKYTLTETGKVVKRINPTSVTRERRRLKAYKRLLNKNAISYDIIEQSYKSWMGSFAKIMSKKQIDHMKILYKELFGKEVRWK